MAHQKTLTSTLGSHEGGIFAPGTVRGSLNMYDTAASRFEALPDGPYETQRVTDQTMAQEHFSTREIKLKDRHGLVLPPTSYRDHYPGKDTLFQEPLPADMVSMGHESFPFTSVTEYNTQFVEKARMPRPVEPRQCTFTSQPWLAQQSTSQATYKGHGPAPGTGTSGPARESRPAASPPGQIPSIYETTYAVQYTPKQPPGRQPVGDAEPRPFPPWMGGTSTYTDHYTPKELALRPVFTDDAGNPYPFQGITEFTDQYTPKDPYAVMPPLTGHVSRVGLQLPLPRRSLGVEFVHQGVSDKYFVLIPRTTDAPTSARQVFTTVHDNQHTACILILYGDDPIASNNILLGQFDIINIPPAPKDVPRIEVTFRLDRASFLSVEARDLDTERHKLWQQRGQIVVLKS